MIRFMLDTNSFSDLIRNVDGPVGRRIANEGIETCALSIVTSAEVHYGLAWRKSERLRNTAEAALRGFQILSLEPPVDRIYGALRAELRRHGSPIGPNDLLIAAHALALDVVLVTDNEKEFSRVPNLRIENWLRD